MYKGIVVGLKHLKIIKTLLPSFSYEESGMYHRKLVTFSCFNPTGILRILSTVYTSGKPWIFFIIQYSALKSSPKQLFLHLLRTSNDRARRATLGRACHDRVPGYQCIRVVKPQRVWVASLVCFALYRENTSLLWGTYRLRFGNGTQATEGSAQRWRQGPRGGGEYAFSSVLEWLPLEGGRSGVLGCFLGA